MKTKPACFSNHAFILDDDGNLIGVEYDRCRRIMLGDCVRIAADTHGYITPGISREGLGRITEVTDDSTDHYFEVTMDSGESGYVKDARIAEVFPGSLSQSLS